MGSISLSLGASSTAPLNSSFAGKNYKSYEDLRGATFGTASLTRGTITALREALTIRGLEYPRDYKLLIVAGGSSANLAALIAIELFQCVQ